MITVRFLYYNWFGIIPDDYTEGNKNMIQAIVLLVFLIFLNSVFAGAEMAVLSMNGAGRRGRSPGADFDEDHRTAGTFYDGDPCNGNYGRLSAECFCSGIFCTAYDRGTDKGRSRCTTEHSENRMYDHCNNTAFLCKSSVWRAGSKTSGDEKSG